MDLLSGNYSERFGVLFSYRHTSILRFSQMYTNENLEYLDQLFVRVYPKHKYMLTEGQRYFQPRVKWLYYSLPLLPSRFSKAGPRIIGTTEKEEESLVVMLICLICKSLFFSYTKTIPFSLSIFSIFIISLPSMLERT